MIIKQVLDFVYFHIDISEITCYNSSEISDITTRGDEMNPILTFRPPEELRKILRERANAKGLTVNALILQILWDWVKNEA